MNDKGWIQVSMRFFLLCSIYSKLYLASIASTRHVVHIQVNGRTMACSLEGCLLVCNIDQIMMDVCAIYHIDEPASSCSFEGCDLVCNDGSTRQSLCKKTNLKGARQLAIASRQLGASVFVDDAPPVWPKGQICYKIGNGVNTTAVLEAINHWSSHTSLRFIECPQHDKPGECCMPCGDFLHFQSGSGCYSSVGYVPGLCTSGGQHVVMAPTCSIGSIIHEIGHSVGLVHEHQRADRDSYVKIYPNNIDPIYLPDFDKGKVGNLPVFGDIDDGSPSPSFGYDYDSVMHYGLHDFSVNNLQTLLPVTPTGRIREDYFYRVGQRNGLSEGDIRMIRGLYQGEINEIVP